MKKTFSQAHPLFISILFAIITIVFMAIAGTIISINESQEVESIIIQGILIWASAILGLLIMKRSRPSMKDYGFRLDPKWTDRKVLWLIPIVLIEISALFAGFNSEVTLPIFFILLFFTVGVGINEEVYYRGLILKLLQVKGIKYAIIVSSILFGVAHAFNALAGKDFIYIALQISFAALFGFVCALIVIITKSIIIPIAWHALHDLLAMTTSTELDRTAMIILGVQTSILLLFSIYLWKKGEIFQVSEQTA